MTRSELIDLLGRCVAGGGSWPAHADRIVRSLPDESLVFVAAHLSHTDLILRADGRPPRGVGREVVLSPTVYDDRVVVSLVDASLDEHGVTQRNIHERLVPESRLEEELRAAIATLRAAREVQGSSD